MSLDSLLTKMNSLFSGIEKVENSSVPAIQAKADTIPALLKTLKEDSELSYEYLLTHTALDFPEDNKIQASWLLQSLKTGKQLLVLADLDRKQPQLATVSHLWAVAEFHEREVFDMFGVLYSGHPDLRRILLEDEWKGHPLLKDYKDDFILEPPQWQ